MVYVVELVWAVATKANSVHSQVDVIVHELVFPVASDTLSGFVAGVKCGASSIVGKCKEILPSWAVKLSWLKDNLSALPVT